MGRAVAGTGADRTTGGIEDQIELLRRRARAHDGAGPTKSYAIVSTPRTSSSMLCARAQASGALGHPSEWLHPRYAAVWQSAAGLRTFDLEAYMSEVLLGATTENGVFGINVHIDQLRTWTSRGFDVLDLGFDVVMWLRRSDKVAQALSLAEASRTDIWDSSTIADDADEQAPSTTDVTRALAFVLECEAWFSETHAAHTGWEIDYARVVTDSGSAVLTELANRLGVVAEVPAPVADDRDPLVVARRRDIMQRRHDDYLAAILGSRDVR